LTNLQLEYTAIQNEIYFEHRKGVRFILVPAGRRGGKTKGACNATIEWMIEGHKILWGDTAIGNIDRYVERYWKPELIKSGIDFTYSTQKKIMSLNGFEGYIDFRSADRPENWEGFGYDKIVLNEAGIILRNDYLFTNAVLPMLMDNTGSELYAIGTPKGRTKKDGKEHRFYAMYKRAISNDPLYQLFQYSSYDNPYLSSNDVKELEEEIKLMNPQMVQQEIYAEFVDGAEGELWDMSIIERQRIKLTPELSRIVVSVDPAISATAKSDETGITVVGKDGSKNKYVLEDGSGTYSPEQWASEAIRLAKKWGADCIVAEKNQGGDMVKSVLKSVGWNGRIKLVTATKGKFVRAEPIYAMYEQGKVFHVGYHNKLEIQMCAFSSDVKKSPDRVDALVWGLTELMDSGFFIY
jgi:phage terminase large subunit-like protein